MITTGRFPRRACAAALLAVLALGCKRGEKTVPLLSTPPGGLSSVTLKVQSIDVTQSPVIKILAQVSDNTGTAVSNTGFALGDFSILEDGKPVIPLSVTPEPNLPLAIVLVIDRSGSMSTDVGSGISRSDAATAAGLALVNGLAATDVMAYVEFDSSASVKVSFTSDKTTLNNSISAGQPGSSTAFFDGVVTGAEVFDSISGRRNILIALGDGDDNSSSNTLGSAITSLTSRGVTTYTVVLGLDVADTSNFSIIADQTDGSFTQSADGADLVALFPSIPNLFRQLVGITYRRRSNGDLTLYLNWGSLTASTTRRFTS